ncbi:hypothetical protein RRG08_035824 [Elysia crispata]|uniref:Uncharacterized protein n=1 Tax=Elysia crispata TaxID=231223 RepID=A0AAE1AIT8_9GAST|nr:hypothetical protein RRG08_035824 [Elysia crispata]
MPLDNGHLGGVNDPLSAFDPAILLRYLRFGFWVRFGSHLDQGTVSFNNYGKESSLRWKRRGKCWGVDEITGCETLSS